ncbi:hypothetical protein EC973_005675, partial [Apophysomyces ossiformis]
RHAIDQQPELEHIPEITVTPLLIARHRNDTATERDSNHSYALSHDIDRTSSEELEEDKYASGELAAQEVDILYIDIDGQRLSRSLLDPVYMKAAENLRDTEANTIYTRALQDAWYVLKRISEQTKNGLRQKFQRKLRTQSS